MRIFAVFLALCACSKPSEAQQTPPPSQMQAPAAKAEKPGAAHVEGQGFVVDVTPPPETAIGAEAKAQVVLKPTGGYHVNKDFPTMLSVTAPDGVEVAKLKQSPADAAKFAEDGALFEVPFTGKTAGPKAFQATFKFAVCTATSCDPKNEKLAWNVSIK
jgi:hypothetical protein